MIIIASAFHPQYSPYTLEGFNTLKQMPEWFQWVVIGMYIRVLGIRFLSPKMNIPFMNRDKKDK